MTITRIDTPARVRRLLGDPPTTPLPELGLDALVDLLDRAGLTGRGGAGFPTARKIRAVSEGRGRPVVVGNAMEGEPLSRKDATLLHTAPGLVLDGLDLLGAALRASRLVLAVGHRIDPSRVQAEAASRPTIEVRPYPGGFVAGQESALVNRVDGRPGVPSDPTRPVRQRGVGRRPTLVLNAETLAQLALVARHGAAWFRSAGTSADPGTFLVSVSGSSEALLARGGVLEVERGTPVREALEQMQVPVPRVRAVLVGGYHGAWLPATALDARLTREDLEPWGATPGAGVLHALDQRQCPVRVSADIASYLARESAGQCGPCVNGLPRLADTLGRLAALEPDSRLVAEVARLRERVTGRGACAHPDGTARFVASSMRVFAGHVDAHLQGRCHS